MREKLVLGRSNILSKRGSKEDANEKAQYQG
jgi:hypothetical protein